MNVMKLIPIVTWVKEKLHNAYSVDTRSLALFRVAVGLVILIDLARRFQHATTFYSDAGVLPRKDVIPILGQYRWSVLFANGSPEFVYAVFLTGFVAAIAMILGWKTRIATILLWIILISLQTRNHHLNSGADTLMRVTLFWAMFLPLGRMWSLDNQLGESRQERVSSGNQGGIVASVATFGLILQIACTYVFTAILKDGPRWRDEGTALYYALGARDLSTGLGDWVFRNGPDAILTLLTFGTLLMEYAVPIMLLLPLRSGWLRTIGVLLIFSLHVGILATMTVGLFPVISVASAMGILPTWFWEKVMVRIPIRVSAPSIRRNLARIALPLQPLSPIHDSGAMAGRFSQNPSTSTGSRDNQLLHFVQRPQIISRSGLQTVVGNVLAAFAIVLVLGWNIQTVSAFVVPEPFRKITTTTGLYQQWSMFAPGPQMSSIWFVVEGELESGDKVDVLIPIYKDDVSIRQSVTWDQSEDMNMKNKYWRKYFHAIRGKETEMLRFAAYSCRTWNAQNSGEERLTRVTLTRAHAVTLPDGMRAEPVYDQLGSWRCL